MATNVFLYWQIWIFQIKAVESLYKLEIGGSSITILSHVGLMSLKSSAPVSFDIRVVGICSSSLVSSLKINNIRGIHFPQKSYSHHTLQNYIFSTALSGRFFHNSFVIDFLFAPFFSFPFHNIFSWKFIMICIPSWRDKMVYVGFSILLYFYAWCLRSFCTTEDWD